MNTSELLLKAILGTLTDDEAAALKAWGEADETNEKLYQQTIDPHFLEKEYRRQQSIRHERPLAEMQARIQHEPSRRKPLWRWVSAVAAAAVVGFFAFTYLYKDTPAQGEMAAIHMGQTHARLALASGDTLELEAQDEGQAIEKSIAAKTHAKGEKAANQDLALITPHGCEFHVTLEDGTEVWLNAESRLTYPETFDSNERRVEVEGEAYFKVARDETKPFIVTTHGQQIHVLGTEFNVHSYAEDSSVETTLVSGSIGMQPIGAGRSELLLTPGHQAIFDKTAHDIQVKNVDTEVVTSWREGKFVFENQTLEQIMTTLARWYNFDFEFADAKAAQTVFMGRIPRYAEFTDVADILRGSGLQLDIQGTHITIKSK